ncbi:MAG: threonine-phosphate decarboxylase CobD [Actinomycetia bacterium]|nr:threonine-phosphate decarboxylase CobD [Actinomycetes bacterium]
MNKFSHGGNLRDAQDKYGIRRRGIIDFSANINPSGLPPGIKGLIYRSINNIINYPDQDNKLLAGALSDKHRIDTDNIIIGNGSNELIYLLLNSLSPKKVIIPAPSYSEYERAALAAGASCIFPNILNGGKIDFDLKDISKDLDGTSGLIFICNPHNPTGKLWSREELEYLINKCRKTSTIILVDEAFTAFIPDEGKYSVVELLRSYSNLVVLKSMTKIYAIPGLRLGYLMSNKALISKMRSRQPNWQVNSLVQDIGPYLLRDNGYLSKSKVLVSRLKDQFYNGLKKFEWIDPYYPSVNFILCRLKEHATDSKRLGEYLIKNHSILIRDCSNFRGLDTSYIRLAVKSRKENLKLIKCLKEFDRGL